MTELLTQLSFSWGIFLPIMYFVSMMVIWWCIGYDEDEDLSEYTPGICIIVTFLAPFACLLFLFRWCVKNGERVRQTQADIEQAEQENIRILEARYETIRDGAKRNPIGNDDLFHVD